MKLSSFSLSEAMQFAYRGTLAEITLLAQKQH